MNIKIFSDFTCPFCYIGFSFIERLRQEIPELDIEWIPFELDPNLGPEGDNLLNHISEEQVELAYKRIERLGSEYGLVFNHRTLKFNTYLLHKAALYAGKEGKYYEFAKEAFCIC